MTSLPCQWKGPKTRKDSTLPMSITPFEKHDYRKPVKRKIKLLENFDPRPPGYRQQIQSRIPDFLDKVRGKQLGISFLLDPSLQQPSMPQPSSHSKPDDQDLKETIEAFIVSLKVTAAKAREIERNTCEQRLSPLWFSVRRYRLTSSLFGSVLRRRLDTLPFFVLRIIQPKRFFSHATQYGVENEQQALTEYVTHQQTRGHHDLTVSPSGFFISSEYSFLGASPDGAVYDPSNAHHPFGFLEIPKK